MQRVLISFIMGLSSFFWISAATAQNLPECTGVIAMDGLDASVVPDYVHQPVAFPGAFGGEIQCILTSKNDRVEQYFIELIPIVGTLRTSVIYRDNSISYSIQLEGEGRSEVVACARRGNGELVCMVDFAAGKGFRLMRFFDDKLNLTSVRLLADPAQGLVNPLVWETMAEKVQTDPGVTLTMTASIPERDYIVDLVTQAQSRPGRIVHGTDGQAAFDFMRFLFENSAALVITSKISEVRGIQTTDSILNFDIPRENVDFLLGRLGAVEQLMIAGYEASRELEF